MLGAARLGAFAARPHAHSRRLAQDARVERILCGGAAMSPMISIAAVTKRYKSGLVALDAVDLEIAKGEIFALLGPNGAGKTTLIGVVCGSVSMTSGRVLIDGHEVVRDYRAARSIV